MNRRSVASAREPASRAWCCVAPRTASRCAPGTACSCTPGAGTHHTHGRQVSSSSVASAFASPAGASVRATRSGAPTAAPAPTATKTASRRRTPRTAVHVPRGPCRLRPARRRGASRHLSPGTLPATIGMSPPPAVGTVRPSRAPSPQWGLRWRPRALLIGTAPALATGSATVRRRPPFLRVRSPCHPLHPRHADPARTRRHPGMAPVGSLVRPCRGCHRPRRCIALRCSHLCTAWQRRFCRRLPRPAVLTHLWARMYGARRCQRRLTRLWAAHGHASHWSRPPRQLAASCERTGWRHPLYAPPPAQQCARSRRHPHRRRRPPNAAPTKLPRAPTSGLARQPSSRSGASLPTCGTGPTP